MGCRIHIHTKHEIEYGEGTFNHQMEGLGALLDANGCYYYEMVSVDDFWSCVRWHIGVQEFRNAIKKIEKMSADDIAKYFDADYVGEDKNKFKESVLFGLKYCQKHGDSRDGYLHFSWY